MAARGVSRGWRLGYRPGPEPEGERGRSGRARVPCSMSNRTNLILGTIIVGLILADLALAKGAGTIFMLKKLTDLVEYLAFWR